MDIPRATAAIALAAVLLHAAPVAAQPPLAEVARAEQARRAAIDGKSRVYTNADLTDGGRLTTAAAAPQTSRPEREAADAPPADGESAGEPNREERGEDYWRDRISAAREARQRAELVAAALQNRADGLWAEFTARDDPQARAGLERDRLAAIAELEQTRTDIDRLDEEIANIQEEARRAGAPPGWLR